MPDGAEQPAAGRLNAAVARSVVQAHTRFRGRGPAKAEAFFSDHIVVVILEGTMTTAERKLVGSGDEETVLQVRQKLQETMGAAMVGAVEKLVGRKVVAFMSTNHVDPDLSAELFVLDGGVVETGGSGQT
jgi:uncharacterized protein YbcI